MLTPAGSAETRDVASNPTDTVDDVATLESLTAADPGQPVGAAILDMMRRARSHQSTISRCADKPPRVVVGCNLI